MYQSQLQTWNEAGRQAHQQKRFDAMVESMRADNAFYREKWDAFDGLPSNRMDYGHLADFPFTTKSELLEDQARQPPFGTNLGSPPEGYLRIHQTSGTTGKPLRVLDTRESWTWWRECWQYILDAAGVTKADTVMLAFSFGPFIGFWSAQAGLSELGALVIPGGGMTSPQRLAAMRDLEATVLVCTPSYALHLAEVARQEGIDPARDLNIRVALHAGEPGAGIPATRERIETLWGATVFDHPGASEVGAFGFSCEARNGVHINEAEFISEVIDPATGAPAAEGESGELVLTNLGRTSFPVVRYRMGDTVKPAPRGACSCGRTTMLLEGGILGRSDDMVTVRGVNVFPSAFQEIFNALPGIAEHRITAYQENYMDQLHVEFEPTREAAGQQLGETVQRSIRESMGIRVSLEQLPPDSLPRFELKAKRFFDRRSEEWRPGGE